MYINLVEGCNICENLAYISRYHPTKPISLLITFWVVGAIILFIDLIFLNQVV